ncbi:sulfur carrier protein ThiS [Anaplasma platys]|nr:sulfur carrier protein ThiS [Anaplasma platys]
MSSSIEIFVSGKTEKITAGSTVLTVVEQCALREPFAIAVNKVLVTKADYGEKTLKDGDIVDVVRPMQGG